MLRKRFLEDQCGKRLEGTAGYVIRSVTGDFVEFESTGQTLAVMIPLEVILEWMIAADLRVITATMNALEMRDQVKPGSTWASQHHSFESHLAAVVREYLATKNRGDADR